MKLAEALKESEIEVAEFYADGRTVVIGSDDDEGGYTVSFKISDMPPYDQDHADTVEQAEQIVINAAIPYNPDWWEPVEGE